MSDESKQILRSAKNARIITCISEMHNIFLQEATDIFYNSDTANLIEEGIADLHCRSDKYLAEEIWIEYRQTHHRSPSMATMANHNSPRQCRS